MAAFVFGCAALLPCALGFLLPTGLPSAPARAVSIVGRPGADSTTALFVKREGRRGPGYKGGSGGSGGGSYRSGGGGAGSGRGRRGGGRGQPGPEPSKDPSKRLANLNRKLSSIMEVRAYGMLACAGVDGCDHVVEHLD